MPTHKDRQLVGFKNKVRFDPADYFDSTIANFTSIIAKDFNVIIKKHVVPKFIDEYGLKQTELSILACLNFYEAALTPADVSSLLRYDPATVTRAVVLLEKKTLLTRQNYEVDTRSVLLKLTTEGQSLSARYTKCVKEVLEKLEETLTDKLSIEEKTEYIALVNKLVRRAKKMRQNSKYLPQIRSG